MSNNSFKIKNSAVIKPVNAPTLTEQGEIAFDSADDKLKVRGVSATDSVVTEAKAQDITGKTKIDVDNLELNGNTVSTTNTNGDLILDPNGSGKIKVTKDIDVNAAGALAIGASVGANTITLGGATSVVQVAGDLKIAGSTIEQSVSTDYYGSEAAAGSMTLGSTTHATKGKIVLGSAGNSAYDEANDRLGLGNAAPTVTLDVTGDAKVSGTLTANLTGNASGSAASFTGSLAGDVSGTQGVTSVDKIKGVVVDDAAKANGRALVYKSSSGKIEYSAVSSTSGINYDTNPDAELDITGYAAYADAAGTSPVDGTGGSPTVTITRSTSAPLRGIASFLITKDAANRQGEGVSYDFTIDPADEAKVITTQFDYSIVSGTYADGDITMWVEDLDYATVIQLAPTRLLNIAGKGTFQAVFQTSVASGGANSRKYRLSFHCASTSAAAYVVKFDNVSISPQRVSIGSPITDTTSYIPTLTSSGGGAITLDSTGKVNPNGFYWRQGNRLFVQLSVGNGLGGAASGSAGDIQFGIPSGLTPDTSNMVNSVAGYRVDGFAQYRNPGTTTPCDAFVSGNVILLMKPSTNDFFKVSDITAASTFSFIVSFPVVGWSSSTIMSSDAETREVSEIWYNASQGFAYNTAGLTLIPTVAQKSTHGAYNASTGIFTAPISGTYDIFSSIQTNAYSASSVDGELQLILVKNGSASGDLSRQLAYITDSVERNATFSGAITCNAGDTLSIQVFQNFYSSGSVGTDNGSPQINRIEFKRRSGPAQIAASESVVFSGKNASTQAVTADVTNVGVTSIKDSHAAWNGTLFTAPVAGSYMVSFSSADNGGGAANFNIYLNGSEYTRVVATSGGARNSGAALVIGVLSGSTISVRCTTSLTLTTARLDIVRVGN